MSTPYTDSTFLFSLTFDTCSIYMTPRTPVWTLNLWPAVCQVRIHVGMGHLRQTDTTKALFQYPICPKAVELGKILWHPLRGCPCKAYTCLHHCDKCYAYIKKVPRFGHSWDSKGTPSPQWLTHMWLWMLWLHWLLCCVVVITVAHLWLRVCYSWGYSDW